MAKGNKLSALDFKNHPEIRNFYDDSTDDHEIERLKVRHQDKPFETFQNFVDTDE